MRSVQMALTIALFALPVAGIAQTTAKETVVLSFEDTSCGAWVRSQRSSEARQVYLYWFRGFVSGYNYGSQSHQVPLDAMPDQETLALYIDKHCRENPLRPFFGAAFTLVDAQKVRLHK